MTNLLLAAFLVGHAAIHLSFVGPRPAVAAAGPPWPFDLDYSRILSPLGATSGVTRGLGRALVAITVIAFAVAALSLLALLPRDLWVGAVVVGATSSIALLGFFFHSWLVLGIAIDLLLIWLAASSGWQPA